MAKATAAAKDAEVTNVKVPGGGTGDAAYKTPDDTSATSVTDPYNEELRDLEHRLAMKEIVYGEYTEALIALEIKYRETLQDNDMSGWYGLTEKIFEARSQLFNEQQSLLEHSTALEQSYYKKAETIFDYDDMSRSVIAQLAAYGQTMENTHKEAERLRSLGVDETDEMIRTLQQSWWSAYESHSELLKSFGAQIVATFSDSLSKVAGAYDTFTGAATEFNENGFVTVDTLQAIIEQSEDYLQYLVMENGQVKLNEEALRGLVEAKLDDLAISRALAFIDLIATYQKEGKALGELAYATKAVSVNTWDLVDARFAELGLEGEISDALWEHIEALRVMADTAKRSIGAETGALEKLRQEQQKVLEGQSDALKSVLDYVMELVRWEATKQVEALNEQIERYKQIIEAKKESLALSKSEADYNKTVKKSLKEIADIQARLAALALDDSREAALERGKLQEELAEKSESLAEIQSDHAYDIQVDTLDKMADSFEEEKKLEITAVEDSVSSAQKVYDLAIKRLNEDYWGLLQQVITYNYEAGNSLQTELVTAWNNAGVAVNQYMSYLLAVEQVQARINTLADEAANRDYDTGDYTIAGDAPKAGSGAETQTIKSLVAQMEQNSLSAQEYHGRTGADYDTDKTLLALNAANKELAAKLSKLLGTAVTYDSASGEWLINGKRLYDTYHTGGIVGESINGDKLGGKKLTEKEQFALLEKGEWVLDEPKKQAVGKLIDLGGFINEKASQMQAILKGASPFDISNDIFGGLAKPLAGISSITNSSETHIHVDASLSLSGVNDKEVIDIVKRYPRQVAEAVSGVLLR
jgi:hypothetical protein